MKVLRSQKTVDALLFIVFVSAFSWIFLNRMDREKFPVAVGINGVLIGTDRKHVEVILSRPERWSYQKIDSDRDRFKRGNSSIEITSKGGKTVEILAMSTTRSEPPRELTLLIDGKEIPFSEITEERLIRIFGEPDSQRGVAVSDTCKIIIFKSRGLRFELVTDVLFLVRIDGDIRSQSLGP